MTTATTTWIITNRTLLKCLAIQADVSKEEDVERAVAEAVAEFGRIDYAA